MAQYTKIEWTEVTWNPVTGCHKVSAGCKNCYAERMARRLRAMGRHAYRNGFEVTLHPELLERPLRWRGPKTIFVNSMSDLFLPEIPIGFLRRAFDVMNACPQHVFQILTKRPEVALARSAHLDWSPNIWMGATVENEECKERIAVLRRIPAAVRFLSLEPLLSRIPRLPLSGVDWVIAGGESGPGARPMDAEWVRQIRDRCAEREVPFFFKQWGGTNKKKAGRVLDGRTWEEMPDRLVTSARTQSHERYAASSLGS